MISRQNIDTVIGDFLSASLETENVTKAYQNRSLPNWNSSFVTFYPLIIKRLSTNKVSFGDCYFRGTITDGILDVVYLRFGELAVGRRLFGLSVPNGVKILTFMSGTGTYGTYMLDDGNLTIDDEQDFASGYRLDAYDEEHTIQVDIYGAESGNMATRLHALFRSSYACETMKDSGVTPLFTSDARYIPFRNDKQQYVDRWSIDLHCEVKNVVETAQQFASNLEVGLVPVDIFYRG